MFATIPTSQSQMIYAIKRENTMKSGVFSAILIVKSLLVFLSLGSFRANRFHVRQFDTACVQVAACSSSSPCWCSGHGGRPTCDLDSRLVQEPLHARKGVASFVARLCWP